MKIKCSTERLLEYIRLNPGLTTCQLTRLLRSDTNHYTSGHFNARLIKLEKKGKIMRQKGNGAIRENLKVWRHYLKTEVPC